MAARNKDAGRYIADSTLRETGAWPQSVWCTGNRAADRRVLMEEMRASKDEPWPDVPLERRKVMASIRGRDTKPELFVRSLLHRLGYRFRVGKRQFGWRPDVLFPGRRKAIFVHGCFWHGHDPCRLWRPPKTRGVIWEEKLARNRARDAKVIDTFEAHGWHTLVLWECELKSQDAVAEQLVSFLGARRDWRRGSG